MSFKQAHSHVKRTDTSERCAFILGYIFEEEKYFHTRKNKTKQSILLIPFAHLPPSNGSTRSLKGLPAIVPPWQVTRRYIPGGGPPHVLSASPSNKPLGRGSGFQPSLPTPPGLPLPSHTPIYCFALKFLLNLLDDIG